MAFAAYLAKTPQIHSKNGIELVTLNLEQSSMIYQALNQVGDIGKVQPMIVKGMPVFRYGSNEI